MQCCAGLAEFGSEQLEFMKLSDWTGNATYARLVEGNVALMHDKYPERVRAPRIASRRPWQGTGTCGMSVHAPT